VNYGVIDIGSNSIRLCIYKADANLLQRVMDKKTMAGLARYVHQGALQQEGIDRAAETLKDYKQILADFGIDQVYAFATASLRNVNNRDQVLQQLGERGGLTPEVLSGEEEARLDFVGATSALPMSQGMLIDIGGGSTELVRFAGERIDALVSLPMGSLNLYVTHVSGLLPDRRERKAMQAAVREALDKLGWKAQDGVTDLCGVGGTVRGLFRIARELYNLPVGTRTLPAEDVHNIAKILKKGEDESYQLIYRMVPERMLNMLPGLLILDEVVSRFGLRTLTLSDRGVREGYLIDRVLRPMGGKI
jgi:exopolyphosphatase/guanosine-5'-triphosphate,3'-diphosphate pyrophosphatase